MVNLNRLEEYSHSKHAWAVPTPEAAPMGSNYVTVVLQESISSGVKTHGIIFFHITPGDGFFSQSFYASATCSSFFCVYSLRHRVCCLSAGLVLFGFPASLSSSACWCRC